MAATGRCKAETRCPIPEETEGVCVLEIRQLQQWIKALQWQRQREDSIVHLALIPHVQRLLQQIAEVHSS